MARKKLKTAYSAYKKKLDNLTDADSERLGNVEQMAKELMEIHGVSNYIFKFGYGWKYLGKCNNKTITIQLNFALNDSLEKVKNTILHEISHAMVGVNNGHKQIWQDKAKELGVTLHRNYHK